MGVQIGNTITKDTVQLEATMATRSTIKDWFVNHTKPIRMVMNTLDSADVVSMPVMPIQWNSVSQNALTWTMLVDMAAVDEKTTHTNSYHN